MCQLCALHCIQQHCAQLACPGPPLQSYMERLGAAVGEKNGEEDAVPDPVGYGYKPFVFNEGTHRADAGFLTAILS